MGCVTNTSGDYDLKEKEGERNVVNSINSARAEVRFKRK